MSLMSVRPGLPSGKSWRGHLEGAPPEKITLGAQTYIVRATVPWHLKSCKACTCPPLNI